MSRKHPLFQRSYKSHSLRYKVGRTGIFFDHFYEGASHDDAVRAPMRNLRCLVGRGDAEPHGNRLVRYTLDLLE